MPTMYSQMTVKKCKYVYLHLCVYIHTHTNILLHTHINASHMEERERKFSNIKHLVILLVKLGAGDMALILLFLQFFWGLNFFKINSWREKIGSESSFGKQWRKERRKGEVRMHFLTLPNYSCCFEEDRMDTGRPVSWEAIAAELTRDDGGVDQAGCKRDGTNGPIWSSYFLRSRIRCHLSKMRRKRMRT